MNEIRDSIGELRRFRVRLAALFAFACAGCCVLAARLAWLQVTRHGQYLAQAEDNRIALVPIVPSRGLIMDRNGVVLADDDAVSTLEIVPARLQASVDSVLDELAKIVSIEPADRRRFRRLLAESPAFAAVPLRTRLADDEVARFAAQRFRFPGVEVQARLRRRYPLGDVASHVLGYIGRIGPADAAVFDDANYRGTDHIGKEGVEKRYERQLHGQTGYEQVERSAGGRALRTLARTAPAPGSNLILSIDVELQRAVEAAFGDQRGALVAIEPSTGEVLAYVSRPGFDPNLFVDGIDSESWNALNTSADRPLLNRPLSGTYAPGSTFKPFMALAALELGLRRPADGLVDPGYFMLGGHRFNDDKRSGHGYVDLVRSIEMSCDVYYYQLGSEMGIDRIHDFMQPFGFGAPTGIDLDHEKAGVLPSPAWKRARFARNRAAQKWQGGDTVSVSIGQGYNSYTPLQLAQAVATLANGGVAMRPHLVRAVEDGAGRMRTPVAASPAARIPLRQQNVDTIRRAMIGVTTDPHGTGYRAFRGAGYVAAGKSGTAQVVGLNGGRYDHDRTAAHLRDNALFIAFAPADAPRIALAVVVENAGWGAAVAAPIARRALDVYLRDRGAR